MKYETLGELQLSLGKTAPPRFFIEVSISVSNSPNSGESLEDPGESHSESLSCQFKEENRVKHHNLF